MLDRLKSLSNSAGLKFLALVAVFSEMKALEVKGRAKRMGNRGQLGLGTILAAFVVVIAAFVVVIVVDEMDQALGNPNSSDLNNASDSVLSGFASMVNLIEPLLLIGIGVVIISLIRRVR